MTEWERFERLYPNCAMAINAWVRMNQVTPQPDPNAGMIERDGRSMTQREEFHHACKRAQVAAKRLGDSLEQMARKQPPPGIDIVAPMDGRLGRFREPI